MAGSQRLIARRGGNPVEHNSPQRLRRSGLEFYQNLHRAHAEPNFVLRSDVDGNSEREDDKGDGFGR